MSQRDMAAAMFIRLRRQEIWMDEKTGKNNQPGKPGGAESHSAFPGREAPKSPPQPAPGEKPIPSQPRSFSPVRPQRNVPPRKNLATPSPASPENPPAAKETSPGAAPPKKPVTSSSTAKPARTPAAPATTESSKKPLPASPDAAKSDKKEPATAAGAGAAASAEAAPSPAPAGETAPPPGSGAGGDTIRLRVSPRSHARTLNTAPGRGLRRRLPDIRQGKATTSGHYGPFALMFGFMWLIFKMVFFTVLVLGLGALIGFMVMTEYIKTPEVIVPNVSGMKIGEAFEVLSDKNLGVIKRRTESSGLVAPGEIISQQPPAGSKAKVDTDVGVVISSGRSQFVVPNVVNETRENAVNKIKGARLEVGSVLTLEDSSVPRGKVISQDPIGGTGSDEAVKVNLMVSAGPPGKSLTMPDLVGVTVLEAKAALKAVGIDDVVTEPEDAKADDKVTAHTPLVGKTVFQTDKITLITSED